MGIILVPTSHIARESLVNVRKAVDDKTECIAVELDPIRYQAMLSEEKGSSLEVIRNIGIFSFAFYWILKRFQNMLSKRTGILPGTEMLEAVKIAREKGIPFALIDQRIDITLNGIQRISISEKLKLFWLLILGLFGMALPVGKEKIDLNKIPPRKWIDMALGYLKKELPGIHKALIDDRNRVMVNSSTPTTQLNSRGAL